MPLIEGIHAAVITVRDLAASQAFYANALDWATVAQSDLAAHESERLWGVRSRARLAAVAPAKVASGRLHLVEFLDVAPESFGHPPADAYGFFAIDVYVRDLETARRRVEAAGAVWAGGPAAWQIGEEPNHVTVQQGFVHLPDDVNLTFVVPGRPRRTLTWEQAPNAFATELTSVVVCTDDVDASKPFWGDQGLGLAEQYDAEFAQPTMARMVGCPDTFAQRMAFFAGTATARVELTGRPRQHSDADWRLLDNRPRQRPGRAFGQCAWVVVTQRLTAAIDSALHRGGRIVAPPSPVGGDVYRNRKIAVVETPERTLLEMWGPESTTG